MTTQIGVPNLVWSDVRRHINVCGLDDELRGTYNALQYAQCLMSEIEFTEMYKAGSHTYRTASDVIVRVVNRKAGK
jgi:hypothetical protein